MKKQRAKGLWWKIAGRLAAVLALLAFGGALVCIAVHDIRTGHLVWFNIYCQPSGVTVLLPFLPFVTIAALSILFEPLKTGARCKGDTRLDRRNAPDKPSKDEDR